MGNFGNALPHRHFRPCALPGPGFDRLHRVMRHDPTLVADRHLLDGVARGEADALRALHQRYGESIYALVYGMLVDPSEAEEVVAETFAHLWRTAARFVATTNQSVSACLKEIARSPCPRRSAGAGMA